MKTAAFSWGIIYRFTLSTAAIQNYERKTILRLTPRKSIMPAIPKSLLWTELNHQPSNQLAAQPGPDVIQHRRLKTAAPSNSRNLVNDRTKSIWRVADAVCFDVDSTVCEDEAIDELAKFCGKENEITQITRVAMAGKMDFRAALKTRLQIINPSLQKLEEFKQANPPRLSKGIRELISALHKKGVAVYLVSGGFDAIIRDVALQLNIPVENIHANRLKFYADGSYAGFDEDAPVSRSGGKAEVLKQLKETHNHNHIVMIGDGATDLQTCPPADAFIGFGGNQLREEVKQNAGWFVMDFQELLDELTNITANNEA